MTVERLIDPPGWLQNVIKSQQEQTDIQFQYAKQLYIDQARGWIVNATNSRDLGLAIPAKPEMPMRKVWYAGVDRNAYFTLEADPSLRPPEMPPAKPSTGPNIMITSQANAFQDYIVKTVGEIRQDVAWIRAKLNGDF